MVTAVFFNQKRLRKMAESVEIFRLSFRVPVLQWSLQFLVRVFTFLSLISCLTEFSFTCFLSEGKGQMMSLSPQIGINVTDIKYVRHTALTNTLSCTVPCRIICPGGDWPSTDSYCTSVYYTAVHFETIGRHLVHDSQYLLFSQKYLLTNIS